MLLDECYRLLEVDRNSSDEEIKLAYRVLTKVWHPDRFGNDASLRRKAEEKLKAINEAHETILASRGFSEAPRRVSRGYAFVCALIAIFILLRRPTPAGLVIAGVLFVVAFVLFARMRS